MHTFRDTKNRVWNLAVNVAAIKRVRDLTKTDLMEAVEGDLIGHLVNDPILLCDTVYALIKPDADAASVTDADFGAAMGGEAIDQATTALLEELVGFFPEPKRRALQTALAKLRVLTEKVAQAAVDRINSPEMDRQIETELARLGAWSTVSPASSASTPAP